MFKRRRDSAPKVSRTLRTRQNAAKSSPTAAAAQETTTGSDMKSPEIGQRNSFGGFFCSCLESEEDERWNEILHLRFPLLPPPPISRTRTRRLGWSFSFSFLFFLFLGFGFGVVQ